MKIATFTLNALPTPAEPRARPATPTWVEPVVRMLVMGAALVGMLLAATLVLANP